MAKKKFTRVRLSEATCRRSRFIDDAYSDAFKGIGADTPHKYLEFAVEDAIHEVVHLVGLMVEKIMNEHRTPKLDPRGAIIGLGFSCDMMQMNAMEMLGFHPGGRRQALKRQAERHAASTSKLSSRAKRKAAA